MIAEPPSPLADDDRHGALLALDARLVTALDIAVVLVTTILMVMVTGGVTGEPRVVLALVFVTFVPGWALLDHVTLVAGGGARLAVAVALSLTISVSAALAVLWLHLWHPVVLLDVLGAVSLLVVLAHLGRGETARRGPGAQAKVA